MKRYFFHLITPRGEILDTSGIECYYLNEQLARRWIEEVAAETDIGSIEGIQIRIVDDAGVTVLQYAFDQEADRPELDQQIDLRSIRLRVGLS